MPETASSPPTVTAEHRDGRFERKGGGGGVFWQAWVPETGVRAVVVVAHGASEHGGRYRYLVERLVPEGIAVYAIDHRGHGRSDGSRALIDRMDRVLADLGTLIALARESHPGCKLFLLGHSMGGCIALSYALEHQAELDGLILSAPVAALEAAPAPLRAIARMLSVLAPKTGLLDVDAGGISRDPTEVRAYDEDPLVYRGKLPARTLTELADAVGRFPDRVGTLALPLYLFHGTADRIVPIAGSEMIAAGARSQDKTYTRFEGYYHELFNEGPADRGPVLDSVAAWVLARA